MLSYVSFTSPNSFFKKLFPFYTWHFDHLAESKADFRQTGCSINRWISNRTPIKPAVSVNEIISTWQHLRGQPAISVYKLELDRAQQADRKGLCSTCLKYIWLPLGDHISPPLSWTLRLVHKFRVKNKKDEQR